MCTAFFNEQNTNKGSYILTSTEDLYIALNMVHGDFSVAMFHEERHYDLPEFFTLCRRIHLVGAPFIHSHYRVILLLSRLLSDALQPPP